MIQSTTDLLAIRRFARNSLLPDGYHFPEALDSAIGLTDFGEEWKSRLTEAIPNISAADASAAILATFVAGSNFLIDSASSNLEQIANILGKEIRARRINYPFVFGRELDDAFVENFGQTPIRQISPAQTQRLAEITPQGVFQVGHWVSGPYGLLQSDGERRIPPQSCGPAIRCNKMDCHRLHHIQMSTGETDSGKAYLKMHEAGQQDPVVMDQLTDIEIPDNKFYTANHPGGLPWLIGNGFTLPELTDISRFMLEKNLGNLRTKANEVIGGSASKKTAATLVSSLSLAELMQLLLLVDDEILARSLDAAIENKVVKLLPTETRKSFENRHLNGGAYRVDAEASHMGVRFLPGRNLTQARIIALIEAVFSDDHRRGLAWHLRGESGVDATEKLWRNASTEDPRDLIRNLIFSSQESLERAFETLRYGLFSVPETPQGEEKIVEKIVWKLGGSLPTPKPPQVDVLNHSQALSAASSGSHHDNDARIVATRSAGMTLFPELEALLRDTSEFACWALLSDHFDVHPLERFRYSPKRARKFAREAFSKAAINRAGSFPYDSDGKNSLAVLIQSFKVLADICDEYFLNRSNLLRPDWQIPGFSKNSEVQQFPLIHTALIVDLRKESRERIVDSLRGITLALTRVDICNVRNDLGHARDNFPDKESINDAIQAIRSAIEIADAVGIIPTVRAYGGETIDSFRRTRTQMTDGNGNSLTLQSPNLLWGLGLPGNSSFQVIMNGAILSGTIHPARFEVVEDSEWSEMWFNVGLISSWLGPAAPTEVADDDFEKSL